MAKRQKPGGAASEGFMAAMPCGGAASEGFIAAKPRGKPAGQASQRADETQNPAAYTKEKLCSMARFRGRADLLMALLAEDERYTIAAADAAIGRFMKGRN